MPSRHLSIRVPEATLAHLATEARRARTTPSNLARTLIEEGLRMSAHPGIVFREGAAGRRPALAVGPDVWEIVRALNGINAQREPSAAALRVAESDPDQSVRKLAESINLTVAQIHNALRYYADYRDEIDEWIARAEEYAERAEAAWRREQAILTR